MATNEKSRTPIESAEPENGDFRVQEGKAVSRTNIVRKHRSTVIVENAPLGLGKLAAMLAQRAPSLVVLCLVAFISFFIGRLTASDASASQSPVNAAEPDHRLTNDKTAAATSAEPAPIETAADEPRIDQVPSIGSAVPVETVSTPVAVDQPAVAPIAPIAVAETNASLDASATSALTDELLDPSRATNDAFHQPAKSGQFTIQIRAYRTDDEAVAAILIGRLRQKGLAPVFKIVRNQNRLLVCVGAYNSRNDKNLPAILKIVNSMLERPADGIVRL